MNWEVIAYGSGDFLRLVLTSIASIFGNADYLGAIQLAFLVGFLTMLIRGAINQEMMSAAKWFITALIINFTLFVPKATVVITDRVLPSNSAVVNNVPLGLAASAGFFSFTGDWFSRAFETVFTVPNAVRYTHNGLLFGHKVVEAAHTMVITDERVYLNFTEFFSSCVVIDGVGHHRFPWEAVLESNDLLAFFAANTAVNAARFKYTDAAGVEAILPCRDGFATQLQPELTALTDDIIASGITSFIANNDTVAAAILKFKNEAPAAMAYLTNITATPQQLAVQSALSNTMGNALMKLAREVNDDAFVQQFTRQYAESQRRTTYQAMGRIAEEKLPLLRALIEAFLYAIFPIIALTALILPAGVPFTYITALMWINLWPPLYAILNFFIAYYSKGVLEELASLHGSGLNIMAGTRLTEYVSDMVATSGYLVSSLPIIAWMLVSRSGALAAMFASRIMQGYDTAVTSASEQITRGDAMLDGVRTIKADALAGVGPPNTSSFHTVSKDLSGNDVTAAADGHTFSHGIQTTSPVAMSTVATQLNQLNQEHRVAELDEHSASQSKMQSLTALSNEFQSWAKQGGTTWNQEDNWNHTDSGVDQNTFRKTYAAVDRWAKEHSTGLSESQKQAIAMGANAQMGFNLVAGGVSGTGSVSTAADAMHKSGVMQKAVDEFKQSGEFAHAISHSVQDAVGFRETDGTHDNESWTQDNRTALNNQIAATDKWETSQRKLEQTEERLQQMRALRQDLSSNGLDALKEHYISRGGTEPEFRSLLNTMNNGGAAGAAATDKFMNIVESAAADQAIPLGRGLTSTHDNFLPGRQIPTGDQVAPPREFYEQQAEGVQGPAFLRTGGHTPDTISGRVYGAQDATGQAGAIARAQENATATPREALQGQDPYNPHSTFMALQGALRGGGGVADSYVGGVSAFTNYFTSGAFSESGGMTAGPVSPEAASYLGGATGRDEAMAAFTERAGDAGKQWASFASDFSPFLGSEDRHDSIGNALGGGGSGGSAIGGSSHIEQDGVGLTPRGGDFSPLGGDAPGGGDAGDVASPEATTLGGGRLEEEGQYHHMTRESHIIGENDGGDDDEEGGLAVQGGGAPPDPTRDGPGAADPPATPDPLIPDRPPAGEPGIRMTDPQAHAQEAMTGSLGAALASTTPLDTAPYTSHPDAGGPGLERAPLHSTIADQQPHAIHRPEPRPASPQAPPTAAVQGAAVGAGLTGTIAQGRSALPAEPREPLSPSREAGSGLTQTYASIQDHEGCQLEAYRDNDGFAIGYGHNLTTNGATFADGTPIDLDNFTQADADRLLREDIARAEDAARRAIGDENWETLSPVRQGVLTELAYQHGETGTAAFVEFRKEIEHGNWDQAAGELLDSETFRDEKTAARMATLATRFANDDWEKGLG